jgi:hypothetical protein
MAVNIAKELAGGAQRFMPENLALTIGENSGVAGLSGLIPLAMRFLQTRADLHEAGAVVPSAELVPDDNNGIAGGVIPQEQSSPGR